MEEEQSPERGLKRTSASNRLNSASFSALYCSISLAASDRASLSFWTRSVLPDGGARRGREGWAWVRGR